MQDKITAALQKLGPCAPGALAQHLEVEASTLAYHVKKMLDEGTLKATGTTASRRLALPDQELTADNTAEPRPAKKHGKRKGHRTAKPAGKASPAARTVARPGERFIPTVDMHSRLVIVNGGEPHIYTAEQTEAIAKLLFTHYEA